MELIAIEFLTQSKVTLTEGLLMMLDSQVSDNVFLFEIESEELSMLIDELESEMSFEFVITKINQIMSTRADYILYLKQQIQTPKIKKEIQEQQQLLDEK